MNVILKHPVVNINSGPSVGMYFIENEHWISHFSLFFSILYAIYDFEDGRPTSVLLRQLVANRLTVT
jgi:hypothetical protein